MVPIEAYTELFVAFIIFLSVIFGFYWLEQRQKKREIEERFKKLEEKLKDNSSGG
jgi:uncharacterized membrane protein YciS (DUF1049 family)